MNPPFRKIILIGRSGITGVPETVNALYEYLLQYTLAVALEKETAKMLPSNLSPLIATEETLANYELVIVVGGDGSLLNAAHLVFPYRLPILGINRGKLGFLADISPTDLHKVAEVLDGKYHIETRFLLDAKLYENDILYAHDIALNDVVLLPGDIAHMITFEIFINNQFVCKQRADGLIIATPTGSTAYALSGGGPILHPQLDAMVLVPMFPHTLSSRPIVVSGNSNIELYISPSNISSPHVSCDGQNRISLPPGGKVCVQKKDPLLRLIHPLEYNYFKTLREKLKWSSNPNDGDGQLTPLC